MQRRRAGAVHHAVGAPGRERAAAGARPPGSPGRPGRAADGHEQPGRGDSSRQRCCSCLRSLHCAGVSCVLGCGMGLGVVWCAVPVSVPAGPLLVWTAGSGAGWQIAGRACLLQQLLRLVLSALGRVQQVSQAECQWEFASGLSDYPAGPSYDTPMVLQRLTASRHAAAPLQSSPGAHGMAVKSPMSCFKCLQSAEPCLASALMPAGS